eukprot:CAMPEP_0178554444 /NCGR_PEP_ID=MMETSP0697-20121206/8337_1 /TAXON_ID=265572 /ORGANISM="Extubocellulus spinifer, Strain CCMP396" /LENGTH=100 /DNA_ID=CAMNT_0020187395 /DNA_START=46 /DNA_END=348 /DNA_ORIENTATION=-
MSPGHGRASTKEVPKGVDPGIGLGATESTRGQHKQSSRSNCHRLSTGDAEQAQEIQYSADRKPMINVKKGFGYCVILRPDGLEGVVKDAAHATQNHHDAQ